MRGSMRAVVMDGPGKTRMTELPIPDPPPGWVLVRIWSSNGQKSGATSECGSNMKRWKLKDSRSAARKVAWGSTDPLGHEMAGYVEAVGPDVQPYDPDQLYAIAPLVPCWECRNCKRGCYQHCPSYGFIGSTLPGGYAEYVLAPGQNLVEMAAGVDAETASLIEPLACAIHGLIEGDVLDQSGALKRPIETAAMMGMGYIGFNALCVLKHLGVKNLVAAHRSEPRLELATKLGATHTVNTYTGSLAEVCQPLGGADVVFEASGNLEEVELQCIMAAAPKAHIVWLGTATLTTKTLTAEEQEDKRKEEQLKQQRLMRSEAREVHPFMSHGDPFPGPAWKIAAKLLAEGCIDPRKLVDGRCGSFEELVEKLNANINGDRKFLKITLSHDSK